MACSQWNHLLASFQGLLILQILITCRMQNGGGRPGSIHHMGDANVDRGREGPSIEKACLRHFLAVCWNCNHSWSKRVAACCTCHAKEHTRNTLFVWRSLLPSVYLGRLWRHLYDKCSQAPPPPPSRYCILLKNWTWEGLRTRLATCREGHERLQMRHHYTRKCDYITQQDTLLRTREWPG